MWLLEQGTLDALQHLPVSSSSELPTPHCVASPKQPGKTGQLSVKGMLTKEPNMWAKMLGIPNTVYSDVSATLLQLDADPSVDSIVMSVDSPGGQVSGLFETVEVMQSISKPIHVMVEGMATSAAYALASQGSTITATSKASVLGSIGVVVEMHKSDNTYSITSSKAPNKRPDPSTEEGQAAIREHLDEAHDMFVAAIVEGRGVAADVVDEKYGKGGVMYAEKALSAGMIDKVLTRNKATGSAAATTGESMDLSELKASHPEAYAAAVQSGVTQERERVLAHVTLGNASGDLKTANEAIESGAELTASIQAKYMAASMSKRELDARADDVVPPVDPANGHEGDSEALEVAKLVASGLGVSIDG